MKSNLINITFFFRKVSPNFHSIEELFSNIQMALPDNIEYNNVYLPYHNGIIGRIKNVFYAKKHASQINHITGDVNYICLGLPKKNTVLTVHDIGSALHGSRLKSFIINLFWFKLPFKKVSKIITISDFTKIDIRKKYQISENKLLTIPNCVSAKFTQKNKIFNVSKHNILIVGTKRNKNLDRIIEALKGIDCKLKIIGKLPEQIQKKLADYDYENFFNLSFDEVVEIYQKSDLLLFPTLYEGFGMPIIEAQAIGIPVITSDLTNDNKFRNKIVENAKLNVTKYKCSNVANQLVEVYKQMLND